MLQPHNAVSHPHSIEAVRSQQRSFSASQITVLAEQLSYPLLREEWTD